MREDSRIQGFLFCEFVHILGLIIICRKSIICRGRCLLRMYESEAKTSSVTSILKRVEILNPWHRDI